MQQHIAKAAALIEALPFIHRFRGETVVIKMGGSLLDDTEHCRKILQDACFMEVVGLRPVIVHGGGKVISRRMAERNLEPQFVQGLRVTDHAAIDCVEAALNEEVNPHLVGMITDAGYSATGIRGTDLLTARRLLGTNADTGATIDWGYVGEVTAVDTRPVTDALGRQSIPVITPLGRGPDGHPYNINADDAAAALAQALQARKLVYLSNIPGLLRDPTDRSTLITHVEQRDIETLIADGVVTGGMIPKLTSAAQTLAAGVNKVHIIDAGLTHSLLLELFTNDGVGTEIVRSS